MSDARESRFDSKLPDEEVAKNTGPDQANEAGRAAAHGISASSPSGVVGGRSVILLRRLVSAVFYLALILAFGFRSSRVEGHSMAPALEERDRLIVNTLAYRMGEPRVGDIVLLYYPLDPRQSFIKRVIAAQGDRVQVVNGLVFRNDVPMEEAFVPREYRSHDDWGPGVVPEGQFFVMGDHRNNSSDSRSWGFVPKTYLIGKVQLRWWPMERARLF